MPQASTPPSTPRRLRARRAFSMIELIVVLSIVMVLTSLLMPGVTHARHAAFRLMCASNLRQIGVAMMLHGEDQNGRLPDSHMQEMNRFEEMCALNTGTIDGGNHQPRYDGLGRLWELRYLDSPRCLYCPAHHHDHTFEKHEPYFKSIDGSFARRIYSNYHFTGPWRLTEEGQVEQGGFRNLNRGGRKVLVTDALRSREEFNHDDGMNVLFSDGATAWEADTADRWFMSLPSESTLNASQESMASGLWVVNIWQQLGIED